MEQHETELSTRLAATVADWKQEVGAAQQALVAQFDAANRQLGRLLQVLSARQEQAVALAEAREELTRLRGSQPSANLPAGAVTEYGAALSPETEAMRRDLANLLEKLAGTVRAWTAEVTQAQGTVDTRIQQTGNTLEALLIALQPAEPAASASEHVESVLREEIEALRTEVREARSAPAENPAFTEAFESLRSELAALRETETARNTEAEDLKAESQDLRVRLETAETAHHQAEARAAEAETAIESANAKLEEQETAVQQLQAQLQEAQAASKTLAEQESTIASLQDELVAAQSALEASGEKLSAREAEAAELRERLAQAETAAAQAESDTSALAKMREELETATEAMDAATAERDRLRVSEQENEQLIATLESQLAELQQVRETLPSPEEEKEAREQAERQLADLHLQLEAVKTEARDAQDLNARLELEIEDLKQSLAERDTALEQATTREAQLQARAANAGEQAEALRETKERLATADAWVQELERQVAELSEERSEAPQDAASQFELIEEQLSASEPPKPKMTPLATLEDFLNALPDAEEATPSGAEELDDGTSTTFESLPEQAPDEEDAEGLIEAAAAVLSEPDIPGELDAAHDGEAGRMRLGQVLLEAGAVSEEQLQVALLEKHQRPDVLLGTLLLNHGYVTEAGIAKALSKQLGLPLAASEKLVVESDAAVHGERGLCTWHVCVPLRVENGKLVTAMSNPLDEEALVRLGQRAGMEIEPVVATASQILTAIEQTYGVF